MSQFNNIVANDCTGARICQSRGVEYNNPFMWCLIPPKDFSYLYNHFDKINLKNIELKTEGEWKKIIVDGKISIYYPHYKFSPDAKIPTTAETTGIDVYYYKIDEYIIEKYLLRVERMSGKPFFVINDTKTPLVGGKCAFQKKDLLEYTDKEDCLIITYDRSVKGKNVVYKPKERMSSGAVAKLALEKIKHDE